MNKIKKQNRYNRIYEQLKKLVVKTDDKLARIVRN